MNFLKSSPGRRAWSRGVFEDKMALIFYTLYFSRGFNVKLEFFLLTTFTCGPDHLL